MSESSASHIPIQEFTLWGKIEDKRVPLSFALDVTARCNNDCRHCYINLPANDRVARNKELSLAEISRIADEAVSLGAVWCLITGGEPLLREDFSEIYITLKRKGLLVSVFTTGQLVTDEHIKLFRRYPPRDIEITVYGVSKDTYECVTRRPGSFAAFMRGLDGLIAAGIKVRLKAMAMRSNVHELPEIARFCRERTKDYFRFDPLLHLRYDGDPRRNAEIQAERLSPAEIVAVEQGDGERAASVSKCRDKLILPERIDLQCDHLFHCGAGNNSFTAGHDGRFRLCSDMWHPDCTFDLRHGSLAEAWLNLVPKVRDLRSRDREFLSRCRCCPIVNLCLWCPARAHLESGRMDAWIEYFCQVAHARADAIEEGAIQDSK